MMRSYTLPEILETETNALVEHEPFELLYRSQLMNDLNEEFDNVSFSPDKSVVKNILDYSKAVDVQRSNTMVDGHVLIMN